MFHEDAIQTLQKLGLTLLQAKVYLALVSLGNATAGDVAKLSQVARQEVYRLTNELEEAGLVSKILTTPTKIKPLPLNEGLSLLLKRRIKKTSTLKVEVKELLLKNTNQRERSGHSHYEFRMIPKKAPWFRNIHIDFEKYQTFDLLTSSKRFLSRMVYDEKLYRKGASRGTKIRIITEKPPRNSPILSIVNALREHSNFEVRYTRAPPQVIIVIMDQREVALALAPSKRVGPPYLLSNHPGFVHMAQHYFDVTWEKAAES